jgi:ribosomal protein S18 acetylase RimI-like enzyme
VTEPGDALWPRVDIRPAQESDAEALRELWEEFCAEVPPPPGGEETWEEEWADTRRDIEDGLVFLAQDADGIVGAARGHRPDGVRGHVEVVQVRPRARRQGVAKALLAELVAALREQGASQVTLEVLTSNARARAAWTKLGFEEVSLKLQAPADVLEERLAGRAAGESFGSVHVQTDDQAAVARAVEQFLPRLARGSRGSVVSVPRNGWVAVYNEACDREPESLKRLARELSDRTGMVTLAIGVERGDVVRYLLYERGRMVDEYLSVPNYYGELPPGDIVALAANPTAVARLTGADSREVRAVARTAANPRELPPAIELIAQIADAMRIEGAEHGYGRATELEGAVALS